MKKRKKEILELTDLVHISSNPKLKKIEVSPPRAPTAVDGSRTTLGGGVGGHIIDTTMQTSTTDRGTGWWQTVNTKHMEGGKHPVLSPPRN